MTSATITSKGQITIPRDVRRALNLKTHDQIIFVVEGDRAVLIPAQRRSLLELRGVLPATMPFPGQEQIRQEVGRQRGETLAQESTS